jgi:hypothetical protein
MTDPLFPYSLIQYLALPPCCRFAFRLHALALSLKAIFGSIRPTPLSEYRAVL